MNTSITSREWILVSAAAAVGGAVFAAAAGAAFAIAQPQSRCQNQADYVVADKGPGAALKRSRTGVWMRLKLFVRSFQIAGRLHQSCNANEDRSSTSKTKEAIACVCHPSFCESEGRSMRSISPPVVCEDETFKLEACRNEMQDGRTDLITMGEKDSASERYTNSLSRDYNISNVGNKPDPFDPTKRKGYLSWDDYFMAIAFLSAHRSKDPNRQVGACLVSQDRVILGIGYNGFPRGCSDDELPWAKMSSNGDPLQTKYPYVCHAEVNAILNTNHASATGQRLYVTLFPCNECAKVIIQAGVAEVVYYIDKKNSLSPEFSYVASRRLLSMAGVKVWQHQPTTTQILIEFK